MRRLLIALALSLLVLPAWSAGDAPREIGAFLAYCRTNGEECTNRIAEINFAMLITVPLNRKWCPSTETNDTAVLTSKVVQWLTAHPEANNKTTNDGIELALTQLYPCKQ